MESKEQKFFGFRWRSPSEMNNFPGKLWKLVNDKLVTSIEWSPDGRSILINADLFRDEILCDDFGIFKTQNFSSFVRQLNLYGFRKLSPTTRSTVDGFLDCIDIHQFHHVNFQRNRPDLVCLIKRASAASVKKKTESSVKRSEVNYNPFTNSGLIQNQEKFGPSPTPPPMITNASIPNYRYSATTPDTIWSTTVLGNSRINGVYQHPGTYNIGEQLRYHPYSHAQCRRYVNSNIDSQQQEQQNQQGPNNRVLYSLDKQMRQPPQDAKTRLNGLSLLANTASYRHLQYSQPFDSKMFTIYGRNQNSPYNLPYLINFSDQENGNKEARGSKKEENQFSPSTLSLVSSEIKSLGGNSYQGENPMGEVFNSSQLKANSHSQSLIDVFLPCTSSTSEGTANKKETTTYTILTPVPSVGKVIEISTDQVCGSERTNTSSNHSSLSPYQSDGVAKPSSESTVTSRLINEDITSMYNFSQKI